MEERMFEFIIYFYATFNTFEISFQRKYVTQPGKGILLSISMLIQYKSSGCKYYLVLPIEDWRSI